MAKATAIGAIKKVIFDQAVFAPICIFFFYPALAIAEGKSVSKGFEDLKTKFIPTMIANYKVWPAANLANFYFMPI